VVVIGTGGVGLNAIQGAVLAGAHPIVAVDRLDVKLAAAREFGATHTINAAQQDPVAALRELMAGRGTDYAFVTVGNPAAAAQAIAMIRSAGTVVIVGIPQEGATLPLSINDMVWHEWRVIGSRMGSTRLAVDVPRLVELYRHGRLKLDELITARYPLEQINEAVAEAQSAAGGRVILIPTSD
jgi:Zn-dependent alcohol dehydrogenase